MGDYAALAETRGRELECSRFRGRDGFSPREIPPWFWRWEEMEEPSPRREAGDENEGREEMLTGRGRGGRKMSADVGALHLPLKKKFTVL